MTESGVPNAASDPTLGSGTTFRQPEGLVAAPVPTYDVDRVVQIMLERDKLEARAILLRDALLVRLGRERPNDSEAYDRWFQGLTQTEQDTENAYQDPEGAEL